MRRQRCNHLIISGLGGSKQLLYAVSLCWTNLPDLVLSSHCVRVCLHLHPQYHPDQSSLKISVAESAVTIIPFVIPFVADLSDNLIGRINHCIDKRQCVRVCDAAVLMKQSVVQRPCDATV
jgi:hypothetical protein